MRVVWLVIMIAAMAVNSQADTGSFVPTKIKVVTVFSNQALIIREAVADFREGFNEIQLEIDAFDIDSDSVTARVFGEGEILSVQFKELPVADAPQEVIDTIEKKIEALQNKRQTLINKERILQNKATFLSAFLDFSKIQLPKEIQTRSPEVAELENTLAFLETGFGEIYSGLHSIEMEVKGLDAEIKVLEQELNARRGALQSSAKVIEVQFNAAHSQSTRVEAQYLVRNAGWSPLYKVSVPLGLDVVDMTMFAKISQKSGENWDSATLVVSNVIPLIGVRLPSLSSWILDAPRPLARLTGSSDTVMRKSMPSATSVDEAAEIQKGPPEAAFAETEARRLPLSFEYILPQPVTIESRTKETILPLFTKQLQSKVSHLTVPQKSPLTYLVARIKADRELLPGPLNVYFGGRYVGKTQVMEKRAGESFELVLGADREVTVKREKIIDKVKETTFFGKVERDIVVREVAYKTTIENLKSTPVTVRVIDNIPVARTDRIDIKDVVMAPEPVEKNYNDREGVMLWTLELAPSEKRDIQLAFVVSYPKDWILPDF